MEEDDGTPLELDMDGDTNVGVWPRYHLPVASLRIVMEARQTVTLPPNAGSTLRGAFGQALRRLTCLAQEGGIPCEACVENRAAMAENRPTRCAYGYLFDTPRPSGSPLLERQQEVPHPYVIRPVSGRGGTYDTGDLFAFEVQLIGPGLACATTVVQACALMGQRGLGHGHGRAELREVWEQEPFGTLRRSIIDPLDARSYGIIGGWEELIARAASLPGDRLAMCFLTPTRLTRDGSAVTVPDFATVVRSVCRRLTLLALFHEGEAPSAFFAMLARAAEQVRLVSWSGAWQDWERYSSRQGRRMTFGGIVGTAVYAGPIAPFLPYLVCGEALHVGKACTFGGGWYSLDWPESIARTHDEPD